MPTYSQTDIYHPIPLRQLPFFVLSPADMEGGRPAKRRKTMQEWTAHSNVPADPKLAAARVNPETTIPAAETAYIDQLYAERVDICSLASSIGSALGALHWACGIDAAGVDFMLGCDRRGRVQLWLIDFADCRPFQRTAGAVTTHLIHNPVVVELTSKAKRMAIQIRQEYGFIKDAPKQAKQEYEQLRRDLKSAEKAFRDDMTKVFQNEYRRRMHNAELERQLSGMAIEEQTEPSIQHALEERTQLQALLCDFDTNLSLKDITDRKVRAVDLMVRLAARREVRKPLPPTPACKWGESHASPSSPDPLPKMEEIPLVLGKTQCIYCVGDEQLPYVARMRAFNRASHMMDHVEKVHLRHEPTRASFVCRHPQCKHLSDFLTSLDHFKNHVQTAMKRDVMKNHDIKSQEYIEKVHWFRQGTATAEDLFRDLDVPQRPDTELPTGAHTPGRGEIHLRKEIGEGGYGVVTHFWNVSDGSEYALKEPTARAIRKRQVNYDPSWSLFGRDTTPGSPIPSTIFRKFSFGSIGILILSYIDFFLRPPYRLNVGEPRIGLVSTLFLFFGFTAANCVSSA
ncbi:RNA-directed DNA polymerase from transposon x-element [Purpureocillium lavendulum]|uniref:RNA-directed DNA polymerase from transposon x-element n=1 Tax=Purpureocillium lavendulum TaxID=1247861 RepID=A0AB34FCZ2_9HYPO|nr:RNA-directed DNA polymerase from transposon x-element [Purpureocillium lavendulum]